MADREINPARRVSGEALLRALLDVEGQAVTERDVAAQWTDAATRTQDISLNGWYDPPPGGVAVLAGLSRISFTSLRDKEYWPSEQLIDWRGGALYAYSSWLNVSDGTPGDFAVTLSFGDDPKIRRHVAKSYQATQEVLEVARRESSSRRLFRRSNEIFRSYRLQNCVVSYTDKTPLDLGHTYPIPDAVRWASSRTLTPADRDAMRQSRRFLNDSSDWELQSDEQFTVEPQLTDLDDPSLPQISYHYVVAPRQGTVLRDPECLMKRFGVI